MSASKKDILEELRKMYDIVFMSKSWNPIVANREGIKLTLADMLPLIRGSVRLHLAWDQINRTTGTPKLEMYNVVNTYVEEMGHYRSMSMIRWVGLVLCRILKRNYSGIIVDEQSIQNAKAVMGTNPVIFAPTHKSYADFILMSFLCFYYDIEIPVIAAGQDFQNMWVMGRILRECCAFFIRRSFGGDNLYKAIIAEYVSLLMTFGHSALEFFIEGTRSRSGKSLSPKYGLMSMALEPYFLGKVPDITIIPVSITYERCLEEGLFARELLGIPKPKESTWLLLKALQVLKENYGRIFVEFGEPISVKKFCAADIKNIDPRVEMNQASSYYRELYYPGPRVSRCVQDLCYTVIAKQNKHLTFTPFNLMAASISSWSASSFGYRIPIEVIEREMRFLRDILLVLGCTTVLKEPVKDEIFDAVKLHNGVMYYCDMEKAVKLHLGLASTSVNGLPGCKLKERTIAEAYPVIFVQQYANPVCLACIHISILNFILCTEIQDLEQYKKATLYKEYSFFRSLFQMEFVLQEHPAMCERDFESAIEHMRALNMFFGTSEDQTIDLVKANGLRNTDHEVFLLGLLHPFLLGYALILNLMLLNTSKVSNCTENEMKLFLQTNLENEIQGSIGTEIPRHVLSLDLISNALQAFTQMGAIKKWMNGDIVMMRPVVDACQFIYQKLEARLPRLLAKVKDHYYKMNYAHCQKYKLHHLCKL